LEEGETVEPGGADESTMMVMESELGYLLGVDGIVIVINSREVSNMCKGEAVGVLLMYHSHVMLI